MIRNGEFARTQMIRQQVRAWDVLDPAVLDTLARVPRERFVPERYRPLAFADTAIPLDHGPGPGGGTPETMMTPQQEGRLLQALALGPADEVLEVGTGSGFMTACLASQSGRVLSLELHAALSAAAGATLGATGVANVDLQVADVFCFAAPQRYDAIAVTGSVPALLPRWQEWLTVGGRLFVVTGSAPVMEACLIRRLGESEWSTTPLFETVLPALHHYPATSRFVF